MKQFFTPFRIVFILLTAVCMAIIFCFSMENADDSSETSGSITQAVIKIFVSDYDDLTAAEQEDILDNAEHIVRKLAHFTIYTALGFCVSCAVGRRKYLGRGSVFALAFCFCYACTDELHQYFVPGRSCQFTDVLIDTSGGLTGIMISALFLAAVYRFQKKKNVP